MPKAFREQGPATRYPCKSKLIGREVTLRGDPSPSRIVGCATPLGRTAVGRRSSRRKCEPALIVRSKIGLFDIETPVPGSIVRRGLRQRGERMCADAPSYGAEMSDHVLRIEAEARANKQHPFDLVREMPFPHRHGSSACCGNSPVAPGRLEALAARWRESGEEPDFYDLARAVYRALPAHLRAVTVIDTDADVRRAIKAVKDHCWAMWVERAAKAGRASARFQERAKSTRRKATAPRPPRRRSTAAEALFLDRAELASRTQFLRMDPARQHKLVARILRKYRRSLTVPVDLLEGEALLGMAARAMSAKSR